MNGGYAGKLLFVNLSTGAITEEALDEKMCREYIGGYGIGARIMYSRQKPGVDPLGPENMLGILTGPMTGTPVVTGARFGAVAKSPLTGGWGDANCGGSFGPYMKFAGFDGVFFTGISAKPVYLLIDSGKAEIKDAANLWGKETYETEDVLATEYGKQSRVICIGPGGEKLSLIACIMTDHGSTLGRSGIGAVMGSKKLKAVVVRGTAEVPVADKAEVMKLRTAHIKSWQTPTSVAHPTHQYGTSGGAYNLAFNGDSPVKNWGGIGVVDIQNGDGIRPEAFAARIEKLTGCWHCPIACKAVVKEGVGDYKYHAGSHRPEYETISGFGVNCLNTNTDSIIMANDICNRAGIDTISCSVIVAYAIECFENGILTKEDTGGIDLKWGNHQAIVAMTEKIANREGLGDILADGVMRAAQRIGKGSEKFAMHVGGQELPMHDPKLLVGPAVMPAARYQMDATPGRHTQDFG
ncbi:MAG TPA: aldehyde ferredoxin oxidoreductase family protein, partial [Dehalococcoidales bacterium]|nr:aldehyde ferredoxin oxidoreductase family protein [Dehalococcoidales bacterium]